MISPERLRRFPFFAFLNANQLRELAIISNELEVPAGTMLFSIGETATALFLLTEGAVELHYVVVDEHEPALRKDFLVGNINPGEAFSISAVIQPHVLTASAFVPDDSRVIRLPADELLALCKEDKTLACGLLEQIAGTAMDRLHSTRILLAAATTPL